MKKISGLISIRVILIIGTVLIAEAMPETEDKSGNRTLPYSRSIDGRPSFWTKTVNNLKASTMLRIYKPYRNVNKLQKLINTQEPVNIVQNVADFREDTGKSEGNEAAEVRADDSGVERMADDLKERIVKDESFIGLKQLANQIVNNTVNYLPSKNANPRSYPGEESPAHQTWNDKDQSYHASTFSAEYEPPFHHHYPQQIPHNYYPASHKDDTVLTKVAIIALLKLILAKLKAIGFLKLMLVLMLKLPLLLFKFLFVLKSFKLLKLISIPLIILSFTAPLLPLLLLFAPLLFVPLLFIPLLLPLLLPLLFFLPIIPVSVPSQNTSLKAGNRNGREATFNAPVQEEAGNSTRRRYTRNRARSVSYENRKNFIENTEISNEYQAQEDSPTLIELTRKLVDSQNCIERVACELASQNDSKIYQTAVVWALKKVHDLAMPKVKRKMERYMDAYKVGMKWQTSDICRNKFHCQRPKVLLIQGNSKYNVF